MLSHHRPPDTRCLQALLLELNKNLNSLAKLLAQLPETVRAAIDAEQVPPP